MKTNDELMHDFIKLLAEVDKHYSPFVSEAAPPEYKFAPEPLMTPEPELEYSREEEMEGRDIPEPSQEVFPFRPPAVDTIKEPPPGVAEPEPELDYSREEELEGRDVPHDPEAQFSHEELTEMIVRNPLDVVLNMKLHLEPQYRDYVYAMVKAIMTLIEVNPGPYLDQRADEINAALREMLDILESDVAAMEDKKKVEEKPPVETGTSEWGTEVETGTSEWKI